MLSDYLLEHIQDALPNMLVRKKVDPHKVSVYQEWSTQAIIINVVFYIYTVKHAVCISIPTQRIARYEDVTGCICDTVNSEIDKYLSTVDRTETWALVPKT